MKPLRDKIAEIIDRETNARLMQDEIDILNGHEVAQSIIAALPDMVAPLVWVKHPSKDLWRCGTGFGTYKVYGMGGKPSWDFDSRTMQYSFMADTIDAAKDAANAHHAAAVVAAITGETT